MVRAGAPDHLGLTWRFLGEPAGFVDNDFTSFIIFMTASAAVFHLATPGSTAEQIPPRRGIKIGAIAGLGVVLGLCR